MRKSFFVAAMAAVISVWATSALADDLDGCVDSPENPTLLLALIGAAASAYPKLRKKLQSRVSK